MEFFNSETLQLKILLYLSGKKYLIKQNVFTNSLSRR